MQRSLCRLRLLALASLAMVVAGCGTTTARLAGAVATPSATPSATAIAQPTASAQWHPCYADATYFSTPRANLGDLVVMPMHLSNLSYGARKLPDDLPLQPLVVSQGGVEFPVEPPTNPNLNGVGGGFDFALCNTSTSAAHRLDGVSVRVNSLIPRAGPVNEWPPCRGIYSRASPLGGGCGGGDPRDLNMHASFAAGIGAGASTAATLVGAPNAYGPFQFEPAPMTSLPITLGPGDGLVINVTVDLPSASGTYTFGVGVAVDGAAPGYVSAADPVLLAPVAHTWSGDACLAPAMQAQIPQATTPPTYYLCPAA